MNKDNDQDLKSSVESISEQSEQDKHPLWKIIGFSVPKHGLEKNENEDYCAYGFCENDYKNWLAVADGATEASYSRLWAKILVTSFAHRTLSGSFPSSEEEVKERLRSHLPQYQSCWQEKVPWEQLQSKGWLFETKARQGAFATFLGVRLDESDWWAFSVGDCHLFIISEDDSIKCSFPDVQAEEFGSSPYLIPSIPGPIERAIDNLKWKSDKITPTDCLLICTDAVAAYLLKNIKELGRENGQDESIRKVVKNSHVWQEFLDVGSQENFEEWVKKARADGLRNDDSTVVVVSSPGERHDELNNP